MKYKPPVRGKNLKKKAPQSGELDSQLLSVASVYSEMKTLQNEVTEVIETELEKFDSKLESADKLIEEIHKKLEDTINEFKEVAVEVIDDIKTLPHVKGEKGEDADEDEITEKVIETLIKDSKVSNDIARGEFDDKFSKLRSEVLGYIPNIDEKTLLNKFLSLIPKPKEIDPDDIIEKIMSLPETKRKKLKLGTDNISGLDQTISAFNTQLSRGYLHGGGISNITGLIQAGSNITLTGTGTSTSPYVISTSGSSSPLTTKGDIYTYSTADARLAVGTNGYILSADSGEATGLKWIPNASASAWSITGNSGLTAGTNFLGTTDDVDVVFKRNSLEQARFLADNLRLTTASGTYTITTGAVTDTLNVGVTGATSNSKLSTLQDSFSLLLNGSTPSFRAGITADLNGLALHNGALVNWYWPLTDAAGVLVSDGSGTLSFSSSPAVSIPISSLLAATATNSINNADYAQTWEWNTLSSNTGLALSSTSTAAASNTQKVFSISLSGANANSTQTTYGSYITNTHTGTSSTNVGGYFSASGGTNNYGLIIEAGNVGIGITAPTAFTHIVQPVSTSGSPTALLVAGGAHTTLTASTEATDINFNLARTVQFATGALTTQRAMRIQAPTYGFVGASTLTDASTVEIGGVPVEGTNATITNAYGLKIVGNASTATINYGLYVDSPTGAGSNYSFKFASATNNGHFLYNSSGRALIGTDNLTPVSGITLTVAQTVSTDVALRVQNTASGTTFSTAGVQLNTRNSNGTNNNYTIWSFGDSGGSETSRIGIQCVDHTTRQANFRLGLMDSTTTLQERFTVLNTGRVGISTATPTAQLHIAAGGTGANTAPIKLTSGSLNTTAEAGAIEFLTDAFYGTTTTNAVRRMLVAGTTGRATGQTAANASVATYTLGAADQSFEVSANVLVTTSSAEAFTVTVDYTDEGNTARTITLNFQLVGGTIGTNIASANGAVPYEGIPLHIRCKASTTITIKTAAGGTYTGCTYNVEGIIKRVA